MKKAFTFIPAAYPILSSIRLESLSRKDFLRHAYNRLRNRYHKKRDCAAGSHPGKPAGRSGTHLGEEAGVRFLMEDADRKRGGGIPDMCPDAGHWSFSLCQHITVNSGNRAEKCIRYELFFRADGGYAGDCTETGALCVDVRFTADCEAAGFVRGSVACLIGKTCSYKKELERFK